MRLAEACQPGTQKHDVTYVAQDCCVHVTPQLHLASETNAPARSKPSAAVSYMKLTSGAPIASGRLGKDHFLMLFYYCGFSGGLNFGYFYKIADYRL
jgi:hypothetical protein